MATNKRVKQKSIQGGSGGGGQQSGGSRLRGLTGKASGKNPKTTQRAKIGGQGGASKKSSS